MSQRISKKHKHTVFCPIKDCKYTSRHWVVSFRTKRQDNAISNFSLICPKHRQELVPQKP